MYLGRNFVAFVWKIFEVSFEWIWEGETWFYSCTLSPCFTVFVFQFWCEICFIWNYPSASPSSFSFILPCDEVMTLVRKDTFS
jgi:hypothetical protein